MLDERPLTPAEPADVQDPLAFAMRFQGRKRMHTADETMARMTARAWSSTCVRADLSL